MDEVWNRDERDLVRQSEGGAKALLSKTSGYSQTANEVLGMQFLLKEIVVVKDIDMHSMCEHYMVPFTGRIHDILERVSKTLIDILYCCTYYDVCMICTF